MRSRNKRRSTHLKTPSAVANGTPSAEETLGCVRGVEVYIDALGGETVQRRIPLNLESLGCIDVVSYFQ